MKILVHGFGPYQKWRDNITVKVLGHLKDRKNLATKIFDVAFDSEMFLREIRENAPDVVIGMGQHPRARKIRIERTAVNRRRNSRDDVAEKIDPDGPDKLHVCLKIPAGPGLRITYNAGDYVCNFSMYVLGRYCVERNIRYGFLHVPMKMDPKVVAGIVDGIIDFVEGACV